MIGHLIPPTPLQLFRSLLFLLMTLASCESVTSAEPAAADELTSPEQNLVDRVVAETISRDAVPAVSIAVVRGGKIACARAYGQAQLSGTAATTSTRFAIGSVSKEFTAAAILCLVERHQLSLDDHVSRFLPALRQADQVTIRELLNHTSGYSDYFTQEDIPKWTQADTSVDAILDRWGHQPLAFAPGSQWQYSSTNFVIAARIVEKVCGQDYETFLRRNILEPTGIRDAAFVDEPASASDAAGYIRYALGPPRPAPRAGRRWLFGMADLEMTASDLARWDISMIRQSVLKPESYAAMEADTVTTEGRRTGYGLGLFVSSVRTQGGQTYLEFHHPGEISGFRAANYVVPKLQSALAILTNAEYSDATANIARRLQSLFDLATSPPAPASKNTAPADRTEGGVEQRARKILQGLTDGKIDSRQLTPDAREVFTPVALRDIRDSLRMLGRLISIQLLSTTQRGGLAHYALRAEYETRTLEVAEYDAADGKIEEFRIDAAPESK